MNNDNEVTKIMCIVHLIHFILKSANEKLFDSLQNRKIWKIEYEHM